MFSLKQNNFTKNLFLFGLLLILVGMPLSKFLMSVGQFVLLANWLLEGKWNEKWKIIKTSRLLWFMSGFFLLHLMGLIWSSNLDYALHDLKIKLPLFWFPLLFISTHQVLTKKEIHLLLWLFVLSVIIASITCFVVWLGLTKHKVIDIRDISIFNSHIRFALMIDFSISFLFFYFFKQNERKWVAIKLLFILWLISFLIIMQSVTGIFILVFLSVFYTFKFVLNKPNLIIKLGVLFAVFFLFFISVIWLKKEITQQYYINQITPKKEKTINGNIYFHDAESKETENGNLVWSNISFEELESSWNNRSTLNFDSLDAKGNPISSTLIRYLTSKGFYKDAAGVGSLTDEDIKCIQNGITNYRITNKSGLKGRIHEFIYEYHSFKNNADPSGHTMLMRLEFWKTGLQIVKQNLLVGVDIGGRRIINNYEYQKSNSKLQKEWWKRSHNQFLAITIAFGILGLFVFISYLIVPGFISSNKHSLFIIFIIITLISMLNEDTLETQAGVTFFGFFYSFLLFPAKDES